VSPVRYKAFLLLLIGLLAGCGRGGSLSPAANSPGVPSILFAPLSSNVTYLMNLQGELVHQWQADSVPALSVYLLPTGLLLRPRSVTTDYFPEGGGNGGHIEELNWDGSVAWSFDYSSPTYEQHHDVKWMPNGDVLLIAWEKKTGEEAIAVGRNPATIPTNDQVWVDHIVEVNPATNQIVWEWHLWDHLLPPGVPASEHPELMDPNARVTATSSDWTHCNAIDYNADLDQIILSSRNLSEFFIIDHSTTTAEAASHAGGNSGHGGDFLFRWGSPSNYGLGAPQQLFGQHNVHWIEGGLSGQGEILVFDNGDAVLRPWSTAVQLAPTPLSAGSYAYDPTDGFLPTAPDWQYTANPPTSLFASFISSAQRLVSGDTLICNGPAGVMFEVTSAGTTVWSYTITDTTGKADVDVFRATRYEGDYTGLVGQTFTPQGPVQVLLNPS